MNPYFFGLGQGWLPDSAYEIARSNGAWLVNHCKPGCSCGWGCRGNCANNYRHWFECKNCGEPFNSSTAAKVMAALADAGIKLP